MTEDRNQRALIMNVGLAPDPERAEIVDALMIDIEAYRPDRLVLLATAQSAAVAGRLSERARAVTGDIATVDLDDPHDLDRVFETVHSIIARLLADGFEKEAIGVNYGSGTKVMGSGLVLAAVFNACGSLRYVRSPQNAPDGRRLLTTPAQAVFAHRDLQQARLLATELRFQSAQNLLERAHLDFLSSEERRLRDDLASLFRAYGAWEAFQVGRFLPLYETVLFGPGPLEAFRLDDAGIECVRRLAEALEDGRPSTVICVELHNSAERRCLAGYFNDAVVRLYRGLEMLAQERLLTVYGIDADNVDRRRVPPRRRPDYEALRSLSDGRIRLGLKKTYELLYDLEDELGRDFAANEQMPARLDDRRATLLAHGARPFTADKCLAFFRWAGEFFERHVEDFGAWRRRQQFPWLRNALDPQGPNGNEACGARR